MKKILIAIAVVSVVAGIAWSIMPRSESETVETQKVVVSSANTKVSSSLSQILQNHKLTSVNEIRCSDISTVELASLGGAVMGWLSGNETHHAMMKNMMGGESSQSLANIHSRLGQLYLGCQSAELSKEDADLIASRRSVYGEYLTDIKGMALYTYAGDIPRQSNCLESCTKNWPPYSTKNPPENLSQMYKNLSTIKRADGSYQYTWMDMPLYFYKEDKMAGDLYGDNFGSVWHMVKPQ